MPEERKLIIGLTVAEAHEYMYNCHLSRKEVWLVGQNTWMRRPGHGKPVTKDQVVWLRPMAEYDPTFVAAISACVTDLGPEGW